MRKIILSAVTIALTVASVPCAFATQPRHRATKAQWATHERLRDARNAIEQPAWRYSGWSAPAGH